MLSKTSLSIRIANAMSNLTHLICYCVKVDLHLKICIYIRFYCDTHEIQGKPRESLGIS